MDTSPNYSPHDQLPAPEPKTVSPPEDYFYQNTVKHLITPTVKLMMTGLPIDLDRVEELETHLDEVLAGVEKTLADNAYVKQFLESKYASQIEAYKEDQKSRMKDASHFVKPFDYKKMEHRSYFMHFFCEQQGISHPEDKLPTGISKWPANLVKKLAKTRPVLQKFLDGKLTDQHPIVKKGLQLFFQHKADLYNKSYLDKIHEPKVDYPTFNPQSSVDKRLIFEMLNIPSEATSKKTGLAKWDRAQVERVNKELGPDDPILLEFTQALIDHSFAAIVRNNFIAAFYKYTVDNRLYGQYKLFGAKSLIKESSVFLSAS